MEASKIIIDFIVNNPKNSLTYTELCFKKEKPIQSINLLPLGGKFIPGYDCDYLSGLIESISFREGNKKEDIVIVTVRTEVKNLHADMLKTILKKNGWHFSGTRE